MSAHKIRVSDRSDLIDFEKAGFIHRKNTPTQRLLRMLSLLLIILLAAAVLIYNEARVGSLVCIVTGVFMLYFASLIERQRKLLLTSEFMSALFSSALGKDSAFTCVVRQDGEMLYFNKSFQALFPNFAPQPKRDVTTLASLYGISAAATQSIMTGLSKGGDATVPALIDTPDGKKPFMITVETIERPTGFALLRGKAA